VIEAVKNGYKEAKEMLGDLPGSSAKLFNDTYELTMQKLEDYFGQEESSETSSLEAYQGGQNPTQLNLVA